MSIQVPGSSVTATTDHHSNYNSVISFLKQTELLKHQSDFENLMEGLDEVHQADFQFEMPGLLFGTSENRVAALKVAKEIEDREFIFVVCDAASGTINLYRLEEIPERARNFFHSYASVLSCLEDIPSAAKLH